MRLILSTILLLALPSVGGPGPVASAAEPAQGAELIGKWTYTFLTYADDTITIPDSSHLLQHSVLGGKLFYDIEGAYTLDTSTHPHRMLLTMTKVNPSQVVKVNVGDHFYCIYEVIKAQMLNFKCSDANQATYPTEFDDALAYGRVK